MSYFTLQHEHTFANAENPHRRKSVFGDHIFLHLGVRFFANHRLSRRVFHVLVRAEPSRMQRAPDCARRAAFSDTALQLVRDLPISHCWSKSSGSSALHWLHTIGRTAEAYQRSTEEKVASKCVYACADARYSNITYLLEQPRYVS